MTCTCKTIYNKNGINRLHPEASDSTKDNPKYLVYKGFKLADTAEPFYELLYLPFSSQAQPPKWKACAKALQNDIKGFSLYYTNGCPFTAKYVPILEQYAVENGITLTTIKIDSREKAQNVPFAWTNFALFYNGIYITNEIANEKKFIGIMEQIRGNEK